MKFKTQNFRDFFIPLLQGILIITTISHTTTIKNTAHVCITFIICVIFASINN